MPKLNMREFKQPLINKGIDLQRISELWNEYVRCTTIEQYEWFIRGIIQKGL